MKRLFLASLAFALLCSTTAFGKGQTHRTAPKKAQKTLVAYFSATGTTAKVAKELAAATGATLFEIKPAKAYTAADLDWHNKQSRSSVEMKNKSARPAVANKVAGMSKYQVIYVGFPIWWGTAPRIVNTFLEQYNLKGKTIIPFATSGGSGLGNSGNDLKNASAPQATWKAGKLLNGKVTKEELKSWAQSN
jgi:flavodoxin